MLPKLHPNIKALLTSLSPPTEAVLTTVAATDDWWRRHVILALEEGNLWQHGEIYTNIQLDALLFLCHAFNPSSLCLSFACFHSIFMSLSFVSYDYSSIMSQFQSKYRYFRVTDFPSDLLSLHGSFHFCFIYVILASNSSVLMVRWEKKSILFRRERVLLLHLTI